MPIRHAQMNSPTSVMGGDELIETKLRAPLIRHKVLSRHQLIDGLLSEDSEGVVVTVVAVAAVMAVARAVVPVAAMAGVPAVVAVAAARAAAPVAAGPRVAASAVRATWTTKSRSDSAPRGGGSNRLRRVRPDAQPEASGRNATGCCLHHQQAGRVTGLTGSLAHELDAFGLTVRLVEPGYVPTTYLADNTGLPVADLIPGAYPPSLRRYSRRSPDRS